MTLTGPVWRARYLALAAGTAAALAHPPFGLLPGLLGYGLLMHLLDGISSDRPLRSAFLRGWLAGTAYFAIGTWWVAEAFLVDIAAHGWMAPFAVTFMAGGIGLFWGAAAVLYRLVRVPGVFRVVVFAASFTALEWLRGHVLTGFPWNLPGETWRAGSAMSQTAALVGAYGLTLITLFIAAAPALLLTDRRRPVLVTVGAAALVLVGLTGWGALRIGGQGGWATPAGGRQAPVIRIVQPDIPQEAKYDPKVFTEIFGKYIRLTRQPGELQPDIIIWPEGAVPALVDDYLAPDTWTRAAIVQALRPGQVLLVGAARYEGSPDAPRYFNSLIVLRRTADDIEILGVYDKHRLVPFGEYLPLDSLLTPLGVKNLVQIGDGFASGPPPRPLAIPGLPVIQPLICYESLYPGFTRRGAIVTGEDPALIVNVSNDAWFGATTGPWQHLNLASYRAIEEGVPMARATPTGVSAMVSAWGQVIPSARLGQSVEGVLDVVLPPKVDKTPYRRLGDLFLFLSMIVVVGITGLFHWRDRSKPLTMPATKPDVTVSPDPIDD